MLTAVGTRSYLFPLVLSIRLWRASIASRTNTSLRATWIAVDVVYIAPTKEVWVTAPGDNSVRILDSQTLNQKEKLTFEGRPEGYADEALDF